MVVAAGELRRGRPAQPTPGGGEGPYDWNLALSVLAWAWTGETPLGGGWLTVP